MFRAQKLSNAAGEIDLYDGIGQWGVTPQAFAEELRKLGDVDRISLNINSPGGDVFDGLTIYNQLKRHRAKVTARIDGLAASIASVIMMAADEVQAPDNATVMIHNPWAMALGEARELRAVAEQLDRSREQIVDIYAERADKAAVSEAMDAETWLTAAQANELGLVDTLNGVQQIAACVIDIEKYRYQNMPEGFRTFPANSNRDRYRKQVDTRRAIARMNDLRQRLTA